MAHEPIFTSESLTQNEARQLEVLSAALALATIKTDASGLLLAANQRWTQLSGLTIEESHGSGWLEHLDLQHRQQLVSQLISSAQTLDDVSIDYCRLIAKSGELVTIKLRGVSLERHGLEKNAYLWSIENITQQSRMIRRLRVLQLVTQAIDQAKDLASAGPEILRAMGQANKLSAGAIWLFDRNNARFVRLSHWFFTEELAKEIEIFWDMSEPDPLLLPALMREKRCAQRIIPAAVSSLDVATVCGRKFAMPIFAGELLTAIIEFGYPGTSYLDDATMEVLDSISSRLSRFAEHVAVESELRLDNERIRLIVENAVQGILACKTGGAIQWANPMVCQLTGYSSEDLIGRNILTLFQNRAGDSLSRKMLNQCDSPWEMNLIRSDASVIPCEVLIRKSSIGGNPFLSIMLTDIRERKQMESARRELAVLREREDFMAALTHDLKNPLVGGNRILDLLIAGTIGELSETQRTVIKELRASNHALVDMLRNLSDIYRMESGIELAPQMEDISAIVRSCVAIYQANSEADEISIVSEIAEEPLYAEVEREPFERVICNLLDQAMSAVGAEQSVRIKLFESGGELHIAISDAGPGISEEQASSLFEKFWQGVPGKRYVPGTGLRLYLCKKIVEAYSGSIECHSQPGEGTTFTVSFPISGQ